MRHGIVKAVVGCSDSLMLEGAILNGSKIWVCPFLGTPTNSGFPLGVPVNHPKQGSPQENTRICNKDATSKSGTTKRELEIRLWPAIVQDGLLKALPTN